MTTHWRVVIVHLHLFPKAECWQEYLVQDSPEERHCLCQLPARFRVCHELHSTGVSQHYGDVHFPEGESKSPGK